MSRRVLRLQDVKEATGLSRSSIYALQQRGIFPQSIRIGPKATGWYEDEVQNYIETRLRTGDDRTGKRRYGRAKTYIAFGAPGTRPPPTGMARYCRPSTA